MNDKKHDPDDGTITRIPVHTMPSDYIPEGVEATLYEDGEGQLFIVHNERVYGSFMLMLGYSTFGEDAATIVAGNTDALLEGTITDYGDHVLDVVAYYALGEVYYLNNTSGFNSRCYLGLNEDGTVDVERR